MKNIVNIPKSVTGGEELIVLPKREYEQLKKHLLEIQDALSKIQQGEKELKEGKTKIIKSLSELQT